MLKRTIAATVLAVGMVPGTSHAQVGIDEYLQQACTANQEACELGSDLAQKMLRCLQLPRGEPDSYKMLARVMLKDGEAVLVNIGVGTARPGPWEQLVVPMIADAITNCEPYGELSGPAVFVIDSTLLRPEATP